MAQTSKKPDTRMPKVIILAAGVGSRIRPLTDDCPKSLLKVSGKPVLERMINNCEACGLTEFVIVLGYLEHKIRQYVQDRFPRLKVTFVVNEHFQKTNTGYSLMLAEEAAQGVGFIKFDADVVFDRKILQRLIASKAENALCIDRIIKLDAEEVKVIVDAGQRVRQASRSVDAKAAMGESIGIEKISPAAATQLFAALGKMMQKEALHQDYCEAAYERLMSDDVAFHAVDITGLNWVEIDTHDDFEAANQMFANPMNASARPPEHLHLLSTSSSQGFRRS